MGSSSNEVAKDLHPFYRVYKDGRVERYHNFDFVPASDDQKTGVLSKDVVISPETPVSARLFLPKTATTTTSNNHQKLPLLIYIHGGAFCIESAFSSVFHNYLNRLVAETNVIAVSIEYRLAPEHPVPACYEDSWAVLKWVASNSKGGADSEPWLKDHADFSRVFLAGDSAGANIAHNMIARASGGGGDGDGLGDGIKFVGMALIHPFFGDNKPDRVWTDICPETSGVDDPRLNPAAHPNVLSKLACSKVLVCVAEKDFLKPRGLTYYEALKNSGWKGELKILETEGESHVFHLFNPATEKAAIFLKQVASFINPRATL